MPPTHPGGPEISVVVCTHNGERRLPHLLAALERQSLERSRYEVVVVDDGSRDASATLAREHGANVVALVPNVGLAAARNAGLGAARAPIVAFTDDDCQPAHGWLEALLAAFADPAVDGIGGRVLPACENRFLLGYLQARNPLVPLGAELLESSRLRYRLGLYLRGAAGMQRPLRPGAALYSVVGANMAFRRRLLQELDGFDEAIRFGGEEEELCLRAHEHRGCVQLRYAPTAIVVHRFAAALSDPVRRARAYGRGHPYVVARHPRVNPIVYPLPVLLALVLSVAVRRRRIGLLLAVALAPPVVYARWPLHAWRVRGAMPLAYAYLELVEELATMVGEVEGLSRLPVTAPAPAERR